MEYAWRRSGTASRTRPCRFHIRSRHSGCGEKSAQNGHVAGRRVGRNSTLSEILLLFEILGSTRCVRFRRLLTMSGGPAWSTMKAVFWFEEDSLTQGASSRVRG